MFDAPAGGIVIRKLLLRIAVQGARVLYAPLKLLPMRNKIVFMSRQSNTPSRDFKLLEAEWRVRHPESEIVMLCHSMGPTALDHIAYLGIVLRQMYHLATSSACILDGYVIPASVLNHRENLVIMQMWHALGAIKKFGHQALDRPHGRPSAVARAMRMHYNYDYVLCGGEASVPVFAEAFGVDEARVVPTGLPRVDYLLEHTEKERALADSESLARLVAANPELLSDDTRKILYAPTFRDTSTLGFQLVAEHFADSPYTLVVKPHDLDSSLGHSANIVDATGVSVLALLPLADVVITDYSAVAFEAAVIGKPVYFFVPDIDAYEERQGLNLNPLTDLPAISSRDIATIGRWIDEGWHDSAAFTAAIEPYLPVPAYGATRRIADLIDAHMGHTAPVPPAHREPSPADAPSSGDAASTGHAPRFTGRDS